MQNFKFTYRLTLNHACVEFKIFVHCHILVNCLSYCLSLCLCACLCFPLITFEPNGTLFVTDSTYYVYSRNGSELFPNTVGHVATCKENRRISTLQIFSLFSSDSSGMYCRVVK
jgi:hypothetical protein